MSITKEEIINDIQELRKAAITAGLVEEDPWVSLDSMWKGPDVDLEKIGVLGSQTMAAVRDGYSKGLAERNLYFKALSLAEKLLPFALGAL